MVRAAAAAVPHAEGVTVARRGGAGWAVPVVERDTGQWGVQAVGVVAAVAPITHEQQVFVLPTTTLHAPALRNSTIVSWREEREGDRHRHGVCVYVWVTSVCGGSCSSVGVCVCVGGGG